MLPKDRRQAPRQDIQLRVAFGDHLGVTRDVSTTGVCFYVDEGHPPDVGHRIHLRVEVPARLWKDESALRFEVEVVRVDEAPDSGRPAVAGRFLDWGYDGG